MKTNELHQIIYNLIYKYRQDDEPFHWLVTSEDMSLSIRPLTTAQIRQRRIGAISALLELQDELEKLNNK